MEFLEAYLKAIGEDYTRVDALRWLNNMFGESGNYVCSKKAAKVKKEKRSSDWRILQEIELEDLALVRCLERKGIGLDIARQYLKEIYIRNRKKRESMYALGFKNEEGDYVAFNPFIDEQIGKPGITIIRCNKKSRKVIHVFENFMDMLAAFTAFPKLPKNYDVICLNSPNLITQSFAYLTSDTYKKVYSWMPNNKRGIKQIKQLNASIKKQQGMKHMICNEVYHGHVDVISWWKHQSKTA